MSERKRLYFSLVQLMKQERRSSRRNYHTYSSSAENVAQGKGSKHVVLYLRFVRLLGVFAHRRRKLLSMPKLFLCSSSFFCCFGKQQQQCPPPRHRCIQLPCTLHCGTFIFALPYLLCSLISTHPTVEPHYTILVWYILPQFYNSALTIAKVC